MQCQLFIETVRDIKFLDEHFIILNNNEPAFKVLQQSVHFLRL